jgi:PAS domain S-box-containing protein
VPIPGPDAVPMEGPCGEAEALLAALAGASHAGVGRANVRTRGPSNLKNAAKTSSQHPPSPASPLPHPDLQDIYRILVEQIPAVIFVGFLDGGLSETYVSPQIEQALGFSQEEWLDDPVRWYAQIHPEDKCRWSEEAARFFMTGNPLKSIYRVIARDGRVVTFQCEAKLVRHEDGRPWFIHGVGFDITELKRLQQVELAQQVARTEESENLLHRLVESMPEALFLVDQAGRVRKTNRSAEIMLGMQAGQMVAVDIATLMGSTDIPGTIADLMQRTPDGRLFVETTIHPCGGHSLAVAVSCSLVRNNREEPTGLLLVVRDSSERKQTEEKLRLTEKLATAGRLAASMAHEINNPLEAVVNLVFLAANEPSLPEEVRDHLLNADRELARVIHIARQTLGFYRDTSTPVLVQPGLVLDEILDLYGRKIEYKDLKVETRYDPLEPVQALMGDLRQVFSNLIVNAIDASPREGRLVVHVSAARDWATRAQIGVHISVADEGPGIPVSLRARIFEPFFSTKQDVGNGLGLWITKSLVEKSGGRIRFRSRPEAGVTGTVFSVFVPNHPPAHA